MQQSRALQVYMYVQYVTLTYIHSARERGQQSILAYQYNLVTLIVYSRYRMAGNFGGEFILADWRF